MKNRRDFLFVPLFLIFSGFFCFLGMSLHGQTNSSGTSKLFTDPADNRILELDVGTFEDYGSEDDFSLARELGIQRLCLSFNWTDIEYAPEQYNVQRLVSADRSYSSRGFKLNLNIWPIHTNNREIPADLAGETFDSPRVIKRYNKMIDHVFSTLEHVEVSTLIIGAEVDCYLTTDPLWKQYHKFYNCTCRHVKRRYPKVKVDVEASLSGLLGKAAGNNLKRINENSDFIAVSYYHLSDNFSVLDPKTIGKKFEEITKLYPGKPIYFNQLGYPSSPLLGSSEQKQGEFIREFFKAWDAYPSQIQSIHYVWLSEIPKEAVDYYGDYYHLPTAEMKEYLGTLGLRDSQGKPKSALKTLKAETKIPRWGKSIK